VLRRLRHVGADQIAAPDAAPGETERMRRAERDRAVREIAGRQHIGLIAQDVETVAPELVSTDEHGFKRIDYAHLTALLVEAVKEQQASIEQLHTRLDRSGTPAHA
jgi:hypothetical protein